MNLVLILHRDQELIISKTARKILTQLNNPTNRNNQNINQISVFPEFPLFSTIQNEILKDKTPQEAKKLIASVQIKNPESLNDQLFFPVEIKLNDNLEIQEKIIFGRIKKEAVTNTALEDFSDFPLKIKTIRLAQLEKTGFEWKIWNDVWLKLHNA